MKNTQHYHVDNPPVHVSASLSPAPSPSHCGFPQTQRTRGEQSHQSQPTQPGHCSTNAVCTKLPSR